MESFYDLLIKYVPFIIVQTLIIGFIHLTITETKKKRYWITSISISFLFMLALVIIKSYLLK